MHKDALTIKNLTVVYHEKPVLWNVTMNIPTGVLCALVGPNGAGKSTLIQSIVGLVTPLAGSIAIFGKSYAEQRKRIAYIPQRTTVDWDFPITVIEVVLMGRYQHLGWIRRPGKGDHAKAYHALHQVGLEAYAHQHINHLSGGQQQRIFLARALVQEADLFILDEPFIGIDAISEKTILSLLKELCKQGKTVLVVHHNVMQLFEYFEWVALLNINLIACGPVHNVIDQKNLITAYHHNPLSAHGQYHVP